MAEATWRFFPVFRRSGGPCESFIRTIIEVDDPKQVYQELSALLQRRQIFLISGNMFRFWIVFARK